MLSASSDIGGYRTQPCRVCRSEPGKGTITITEGKYHQIKLMMQAVHNQIQYLERRTFGALTLDPALERGAWRELTAEEIDALRSRKETDEKDATQPIDERNLYHS